MVEQLSGSPPLAAQPAPVGRKILLGSQVDPVGSDPQGDAALQRAVRAVRRRRLVIHASTVRLPRFRAVVCRLRLRLRAARLTGCGELPRGAVRSSTDVVVTFRQMAQPLPVFSETVDVRQRATAAAEVD